MIEFISGILIESDLTSIVVQTGGIGWRVPITSAAQRSLPAEQEPITLSTYLVVREDALTLYGFSDPEERSLFERLIQVSGIGPKLAMTALSGMSQNELRHSIVTGDVKRLSSIPGIGKKMAERMSLELKDKLPASQEDLPSTTASSAEEKHIRDAMLALVALGYKQQEARTLLEHIPDKARKELEVEEMIRIALKSS